MGANIKQLRTRIKSVSSTRHLTKAMGLVASSKIRRSIEAMSHSGQYAAAVEETVEQLSFCRECEESPYMSRKEDPSVRLVVIAGDRGLAGGYNANIFRFMRDFTEAFVIPIGKRACERFGGTMRSAEDFSYEDAGQMADGLCRDFCEGRFGRLGIVYTKYHSMMSQEAAVRWILPLERAQGGHSRSYLFEPDELTVLNRVVPEYVAGMVFACVKESFASEVAARRVAMDSADKNAQQMLSDLKIAYNRARQGAITQEITEIVAGSGSLS